PAPSLQVAPGPPLPPPGRPQPSQKMDEFSQPLPPLPPTPPAKPLPPLPPFAPGPPLPATIVPPLIMTLVDPTSRMPYELPPVAPFPAECTLSPSTTTSVTREPRIPVVPPKTVVVE